MGGSTSKWLAFVAFAVLGSARVVSGADASRPNIVLILADDLGYSDIGCYGGEINTPNIDKLAAGGLRFTQFYNAARCCPTRAALMTGLYPHQAGVGHMVEDRGRDGYRGQLNKNCVTIAEALKPAGYQTWLSGKWHLTRNTSPDGAKEAWPPQRGFDKFFGLLGSVRSYYDPPTLMRGNEPAAAGKDFYLTDAITDNAIAFLNDAKNDPFFLYVAYTAPHWPLHAVDEDVAKYRKKFATGWDRLRRERLDRQVSLGLVEKSFRPAEKDPAVPAWEGAPNKEWEIERMAVYAAMVERMDCGIGRIVEKLRAENKLNNTVILFLADNGACAEDIPAAWAADKFPARTRDGVAIRVGNDPATMPGPAHVMQSYGQSWAHLSNTPFREYKHFVHEGGIASPLIVHWPAGLKKTNEWRRQPAHVIDIMPTCLEIAGAKYPATATPVEGRSIIPALTDEPIDRDALFWEHEGNRAVRKDNWKLVAKGAAGKWELYDVAVDRGETNNLAAKDPERVAAMAYWWDKWAEHAGVLPSIWSPLHVASEAPKEQPDHSKVPGSIVAYSPASSKQYIGSPSLVVLRNGDYLASHDLFGPGSTKDQTRVYISTDHGHTWSIRAEVPGQWWSSMFRVKDDVYLIGTSKEYGHCVIRKSSDSGKTWTTPKDKKSGLLLDDGPYHCAPVPIVVHDGRIWRAMEDAQGPGKWGHHFRSFMMSAPIDGDLLDASSWTTSNRIGRNADWLGGKFGGWLEGNAVLTPDGKIVNVLRVDYKDYPEKAAIIEISADGKTARFEPATGFLDWPGGGKKFAIRFDPVEKCHWMLANVVPKEFETPSPPKVRNTLALFRSTDARGWEQRAIVLQHPDIEKHGCQYPDFQIDGDDMIVLSRTAYDDGIGGAHNQHDANYLTFHRIKKFREAKGRLDATHGR